MEFVNFTAIVYISVKIRDGLENIFMIPVAIAKVSSSINGEIRVVEQFGRRRLSMGGLTQSGGIVEELWKKTIEKDIRYLIFDIRNILILGLGAGSAAKIVAKKWPRAKIVGVEIDPGVVNMGKKYFNLDKIANLEIVIDDANKWINQQFNHLTIKQFDLVLVDTYLGDKVPNQMETEKLLTNLKQLLSNDGLAIFNRLYFGKHKKTTNLFLDKLRKIFKDVRVSKFPNFFLPSNLLIYCQ